MRWRQFSKPVAVTVWISLVASSCDVDDNNHNNASGDGEESSGRSGPSRGGRDDSDSDHDHARDGSVDNDDDGDGADGPQVTLDQGKLMGVCDDDKICRFLGIPYAKPPVGERRWRPSEPPDTWDGVRNAKAFGHRCAQAKSILYQSAASSDEDCLTVNVWTPSLEPDAKLPVMVWIHGGGHTNGSSAEPVPYAKDVSLYDGGYLAAKNVVVVTLNYRLGPLGFFSHPALRKGGGRSGDQGLWDQQLALRWVKKNIASFGGDGRNITIFGQASGAVDVCLHVVSPKSRGLFQQAIGQSGGCTTSQPTAADVAVATSRWIGKLGCGGDDPLACLRSKSVSELLGALPASDSPFVPIVDGSFIPEQPRYAFTASDVADVPYLLGSNTDEGASYASQYAALSTEDDYHAVLQRVFPHASLKYLYDLYPAARYADSVSPYQTALEHVFGDAWWICPTLDTARRAAKAQLNVFVYNSDLPTHLDSLGAPQGAEIGYVFGTRRGFTSEQRDAGDLLQSYWTNLALQGDPNGDKLFEWPRLTTSKDTRVNFALGATTLAKDFHNAECTFWREVYDGSFKDDPSPDDSDWESSSDPSADAKPGSGSKSSGDPEASSDAKCTGGACPSSNR